MTPKTQARHASGDTSTFASSLKKDAVSIQTAPDSLGAARKGRPLTEYRAVESQSKPAVARQPEDRVRTISYAVGKRLFDLTVGSLLLVIATPIVLIAAVGIRIDTPGSPFFFQTRLGQGGKPFKIFKLRGMYIDAKTRFPTFYDYSHKRDLEFCFHHADDPRVTPAGRVTRKMSIDELPNLWNVVRGDMSLVGPRPEIPEVLALYGGYRDQYLSVKPGITCLSKITGRDKLTKRETVEFDLDYIRRRSFMLDCAILWKTLRSVLLRRDVF